MRTTANNIEQLVDVADLIGDRSCVDCVHWKTDENDQPCSGCCAAEEGINFVPSESVFAAWIEMRFGGSR